MSARRQDHQVDLAPRSRRDAAEADVEESTPTDNAAAASEAQAARRFEGAFGADFSGVQVERGAKADAMGVQAYAQGEQIQLSSGAPALDSREGNALLGHEVTHVVQQRQGRVATPQAKGAPVVGDQSLEAEADAIGAQVGRGEQAPAAMRGVGGAASGAAQGKAEDAPIQCFGSLEHKAMGDQGSGGQQYRWDSAAEQAGGKRSVDAGFTLTHGDITMLSGDLFEAHETDEQGNPISDNLFALAHTPGQYGAAVGTQDEIMYAIYKENPSDLRFKQVCPDPTKATQENGAPMPAVTFPLMPDPQHPLKPYFSEEVKKTVDMRYLNLAAKNKDHFAQPDGLGTGGAKSGDHHSAGGSYRALHETAIDAAFTAGQRGEAVDEALAHEAAAEHYLTDAFSAGHLRTPTGQIKAHWDAIYPNFWHNLKHFIAHRMSAYMNDNETDAATLLGTVSAIEGDVNETLEKKVAAYPAMGFERLVALATHDVDNREGVKVINDLGERWTAYGDGQMKVPGHDDSQKRAIEAVQLGCQDIKDAHTMPMIVVDAHAQLMVGDKYRAEQKMPQVDAQFETTTQSGWQAASLDDLWTSEIRSGSGYTYGMEIERSAQSGDISEQMSDMSGMIDPVQSVHKHGIWLGDLHPKAAFEAAVAGAIKSNPHATLKRIIDFDPSTDQAFFNEDDAVMDEIDSLENEDKKANADKQDGRTDHNSLKGLTLDQRSTWIKNIMGGTFSSVSDDEESAIIKVFETCPARERPHLYEMIEGHAWKGHYVEGWFVDDDELWNSLSGSNLDRVRDLINEGT